ncbi:MAG: DUF371 domain-containing protein [Methanobacteriaceae archaeon]|jgi:hypothetical protein|uniref:DUF371 domain-containing protein n=1 Tax=Methanobrevibacter TaxID=2172 RepID=UPI002A14AFE1|nr:DUF371 domain-containing protein [Methanobacteriaceae archaeon]MDD3408671.1 DUF371 domain-containing protein [Methanobacteriaceae archaeon]
MNDYNFKIRTKGHKNVTSKHKSTFEITKDSEIGKTADCIIGVKMDKSLLDFPDDFKEKIRDSNTQIIMKLKTIHGFDEIQGYGDEKLTLNHPTDIVCRKSNYTCNRTLMVNANKASCDLNADLIDDLSNGELMDVEIILK